MAKYNEVDKLLLSSWSLPKEVTEKYHQSGIMKLFQWQADCLCTGNVLNGENLVYCAPTSAGKTLVAELLMLKRVVETKKKVIMILPFVSVAREKVLYLQNMFQDVGIAVDGYFGNQAPQGGLSTMDIAVCTIEKANGIINKLMEEKKIDTLGMVVVDELHMIGDIHRGYLLELILTKIKYLVSKLEHFEKQKCVKKNLIQIVGMSAILPNLKLLANWLDAQLYYTDFRPVPLIEMVKIGNEIYDKEFSKMRTFEKVLNSKDEDQIVALCLETICEGFSVLIFCPSKAGCEKLADSIAREFYKLNESSVKTSTSIVENLNVNLKALCDVCEQLKRSSVGLDSILGKTIPQGVAFHHAGLTFDERDIVEGAFRNMYVKVLVATSTLSSGVNLPARRVIIRTPNFYGGNLIDPCTYKQMIGRAGRKGVDTMGESILICKPQEKSKAELLLKGELPPVKSSLQRPGDIGLSSSMKRAILEVVVSGVAKTPQEINAYASSTMLAASMQQDASDRSLNDQIIKKCAEFLKDNEFIFLKGNYEESPKRLEFVPTQLGVAVLASALSPDEGLLVFKELQKARKCFVLENELHILYLVTPIYMVISQIDWWEYLCIWEKLPADMKRVSDLVGVSESFLSKAAQGNIRRTTGQQERIFGIHRRFYTCLILQDLVNEISLNSICKKYKCNRGTVQSLQQSAATFAGMVTVFCNKLGWVNLEVLLSQFQSRLTFGVQRELVNLVRITLLNARRARILFDAGFETVANLAKADPGEVEMALKRSVPFMSKKKNEDESEWEANERKKSHCIFLTGQKSVTEYEAAVMIVDEAKCLLKQDLLQYGIEWKSDLQNSREFKREKFNDEETSNVKLNNIGLNSENTEFKNISLSDSASKVSNSDLSSVSNSTVLCPPISFSKEMSTPLQLNNENHKHLFISQEQHLSMIKYEKNKYLDKVCSFNISGELDLTCLGCDSPCVKKVSRKSRKRSSLSSIQSVSMKSLKLETEESKSNLRSICTSSAGHKGMKNTKCLEKASLKYIEKTNIESVNRNSNMLTCTQEIHLDCEKPKNTTDLIKFTHGDTVNQFTCFSKNNCSIHSDLLEENSANYCPTLSDPKKSNNFSTEKEGKYNNPELSDNSITECLPPTPSKCLVDKDNQKNASAVLVTEKGKASSEAFVENKVYANVEDLNKLNLHTLNTSRANRSMRKFFTKAVDTSFNPNLDESFSATNQTFTIIDVCANSNLFYTFISEWQNQKQCAISLSCEKLPVLRSKENIIGGNFEKREGKVTQELEEVDGIILEQFNLIVTGLAVSWSSKDAYFIAFTKDNYSCDGDLSLAPPHLDHNVTIDERKIAVKEVLQHSTCVGAFDIKSHYKILFQSLKVKLTCRVEDPKLAEWLLNPDAQEKCIHQMVHNYLPFDVYLLQDIGGGIGFGSIGITTENPGSGRLRSCVESVLVNHLVVYLSEELKKQSLLNVYLNIETWCSVILAKMELNGMGFNPEECDIQKNIMKKKLLQLEEEAYTQAGHSFSLSSSSDLSLVLFTELKLPPSGDPFNPGIKKMLNPSRILSRGKVKQKYGTSKDVLQRLASIHCLPKIILEWRRITNTLTKTVFPLQRKKLNKIKLGMYRIHGISQSHTSTGRVSMQEPNFQNIPKEFKMEVKPDYTQCKTNNEVTCISMRNVFIPFDGGVILAADYSQLELRIIAHLANDVQLIQILNSGVDVFKTIAAKWKNTSVDEISTKERQHAKQICYGILYGIGPKSLAEQLGVDESEAAAFIESFKSKFIGLRSFLRDTVRKCKDQGYVETIFKRKRYLPAIKNTNCHAKAHAERQAVNTTVQGSAADIVKQAMIQIDRALTKEFPDSQSVLDFDEEVYKKQNSAILLRGAYFILQLHDELIFEVNKNDVEIVAQIVKHNMENATKLRVNLPVKISIGPSWGALSEMNIT